MRRRSTVVLVCALLAGCPKTERVEPDASPSPSPSPSPSANVVDARTVVVNGCLSCHSEHMLAQQRLTEAQWQKVVTKMVGWGANVEPSEVAPLVAHLSASYGPDAGAYDPETIAATAAAGEVGATPDEPLPAGDRERGKALYADKCSGCHGADARGATGVMLIDRPLLYRAADFAKTVRRGRGKMLPIALSDAQLGDVLAHLRSLKHGAP